jgi:anti-anti-sigma factor
MQLDIKILDKDVNIQIKEQLIYSDTAQFSSVIQKIKEADAKKCSVDLHMLDHIDSSGLRMLLLLYDACKDKNAALSLSGAKGQVKEMLLHCRFDTIVAMDL